MRGTKLVAVDRFACGTGVGMYYPGDVITDTETWPKGVLATRLERGSVAYEPDDAPTPEPDPETETATETDDAKDETQDETQDETKEPETPTPTPATTGKGTSKTTRNK